MKCVSISGERKLVLKEINKPVSKDGSVVIEVRSCGICGSDIHNWVSGKPVGLVRGHEFAGVVVDPGSRLIKLQGYLFLHVVSVMLV